VATKLATINWRQQKLQPSSGGDKKSSRNSIKSCNNQPSALKKATVTEAKWQQAIGSKKSKGTVTKKQ